MLFRSVSQSRYASEQDIENIRNGKEPEFGVMYYNPNGYKIHRRYGAICVEDYLPDGVYLFESADGKMLWPCSAEQLFYKLKGQGAPAKPKKPHIKGTKPFVYDPAKIVVGTTVKCRDKKIRTVVKISIGLMDIVYFDDGEKVDGLTGIACRFRKSKQDIVAILDDD